MKSTLTFLHILLAVQFLSAQQAKKISAVSERVYISVAKPAQATPYLEISNYQFTDGNGNNKIDAGETVKISFDLVNTGKGTGAGLKLVIEDKNKVGGLDFIKPNLLNELKSGDKEHIELSIVGNMNLKDSLTIFNILVNEPNGFGTDPLEIEIETQAFRQPMVKLVDYQVSSQSGTKLEKRKPFDLEVLVQNLGQGVAEKCFSNHSNAR